MRTKTLLLSAVAMAAGLVSSVAQSNVYSVNIVGYANQPVPNGYSMFSAPFKANGSNNAEAVLPCLTSGDQLLIWNGNGYDVDLYIGPNDWYNGVTFDPIAQPNLPGGTAFFYQNNQGVTLTNTYVGDVVLSNTVPLPNGYSMVGPTTPIAGSIESTNFNIPFQAGDQVLIWNGNGYDVDLYIGPGDWYNGVTFDPIAVPNLTIGQGFFFQNNQGVASSWTQQVTVQ